MDRKDYLSYSRLAGFDRDGYRYFNKEPKDSVALNIGSLVDELLTSDTDIKTKYVIISTPEPTASAKKLMDSIKDDNDIVLLEKGKVLINMEAVDDKIKELKLWSKIVKKETLRDKWWNANFKNYLKEYLESNGRTIIALEDYELAKALVGGLRNDPESSLFFNKQSGVELIFQQEIMWTYNDQLYRSFLDVIRVDHINKEITPADLKTGEEHIDKFSKAWNLWRYDLQYSMYMQAVIEWAGINFPDYNIIPMVYIFASKKAPKTPVVYDINISWMDAGRVGYKDGYYRKGWMQLAEDINWHYKNNVYDKPKYLAEQGRMFLDFYGEV